MHVLWSHENGATVREIVLAVYGRHEHSLHAGVKSYLQRLQDKGLVSVDKSDYSHRFHASVSRSHYVGQTLKVMADSHFGGSIGPLMLSLADQVRLSKKDRQSIEAIIEKMED